MQDYRTAKEYLDSFVDYEKRAYFSYKRTLKLERVSRLFDSLTIEHQKLKFIHIAGTKGKGSTATFCAYILAASGFRVGLYTSPHFFDFRERIKILKMQNDKRPAQSEKTKDSKPKVKSFLISKKDVIRIVGQIKPQLENLRISKKFGSLTFFEVYTAIAFKYFIDKEVHFVVLETGLGGRLDATNAVTPLASIITHVGYDHTDKLGNRLAQIAYEKAGIIKKNVPVVSCRQQKSVMEVLRKKSRQNKSELFLFGRDFFVRRPKLKRQYSTFDFRFRDASLKNLKIFLKGKTQIENASLAITACLLLNKEHLSNRSIRFHEGLSSANIEGRFEALSPVRKLTRGFFSNGVSTEPLLILDVAHNTSSFAALRENLKLYYPDKKIILIFAASKDKDVKGMLNKICPDTLVLTSFHNPRSYAPRAIQEITSFRGALMTKDIKEALALALSLYTKDSLIIISGSFFLVSEAKEFLSKHSNAFIKN